MRVAILLFKYGFIRILCDIIRDNFSLGDSLMKKYVTLVPGSSHHIYKIGLGTYNILNSGLSEEKLKELLTDFLDMGGNVIDTSISELGLRRDEIEESQKFIGRWISSCNRRKSIYLISKSAFLLSDNTFDSLLNDVNISLKNLSTSYLDLLLIDGDDETTDISLIFKYLENIKKDGKILSYGCSNWKPYRIRQAMEYAKKHGIEGFTVNQMLWNAGVSGIDESKIEDGYVKMDSEMMEIHKEFNILAMPYSALANGFFAKLYLNEMEPQTVNMEELKLNSPYYTEKNLALYEELKIIGEKYIASPSWAALGYLFNQHIETCSIISVNNLNQLKEAFEAIDIKYTFEDFKSIDMFNSDEVLV